MMRNRHRSNKLERNLEKQHPAEFQRGKIAVRRALVVRVANGKNLAREDASLGHGPRIGDGGFRFKNGENDGVPSMNTFFANSGPEVSSPVMQFKLK